jgi:hypothetical protein
VAIGITLREQRLNNHGRWEVPRWVWTCAGEEPLRTGPKSAGQFWRRHPQRNVGPWQPASNMPEDNVGSLAANKSTQRYACSIPRDKSPRELLRESFRSLQYVLLSRAMVSPVLEGIEAMTLVDACDLSLRACSQTLGQRPRKCPLACRLSSCELVHCCD